MSSSPKPNHYLSSCVLYPFKRLQRFISDCKGNNFYNTIVLILYKLVPNLTKVRNYPPVFKPI